MIFELFHSWINTFAANYEYMCVAIEIYCASQEFKIKVFPDSVKSNEWVYLILY